MKLTITKSKTKQKIFFVELNKTEALRTIESLITQINYSNPNMRRLETTTQEGYYFSIGVIDEETKA